MAKHAEQKSALIYTENIEKAMHLKDSTREHILVIHEEHQK